MMWQMPINSDSIEFIIDCLLLTDFMPPVLNQPSRNCTRQFHTQLAAELQC